jgi:hypothetical protein
MAEAQGHVLGHWHERLNQDGCEVAYCRTCRRSIEIDVDRQPTVAGQAMTERCQVRPDAFLANLDPRRV